MPLSGAARSARDHHRFLLIHGLALPLAWAALALWLGHSGWDTRISGLFYDVASQRFLASGDGWVELIGHRLAKSALLAIWFLALVAAVAAARVPALRPHRRVVWATVAAMALGPLVVSGLKDINTQVCPWSLRQFGGTAAPGAAEWFVTPIEAGRCFPGGHAAGGFSLIAFAFAGRAAQWPRLQRAGWLAAVTFGTLLGAVRLVQGAHFLSHNLWAAAIDWWMATLCFLPLLLGSEDSSNVAAKALA